MDPLTSARLDIASHEPVSHLGDTRIERRGDAKRILILGAGLSGLVAGYELTRAGHYVTILEGRMRPGGRVYTLRTPFSDGLIAEAGAGRIPASHHWTRAYIDQFGLSTVPFAPASLAPLVLMQGKQVSVTPATRLARHFDVSADEKDLQESEMAQRYIAPAIKDVLEAGDLNAPDWPPPSLRRLDRYSFPEFLRRQGASAAASEILFSGAFPKEASALFVLRVFAASVGSAEALKIKGGNDLLPQAIAAQLADRILYGAQVIQIAEEGARVRATFLQGRTHHSLQADYLICYVSFSLVVVLESLPHFSSLKQQAIREMSYTSVVKVALQTKTRSWEQQGLSGFARTDALSEVWSPAWDQPTKQGILQLYQQGPVAQQLDLMSPEERLQFAAKYVCNIFPEMDPDLSKSTSYSWQLDDFARGAYGQLLPGNLYSWNSAAATPEGRIHFAGEHLSAMPAYMQGAISSGHRAATEVNER